MTFLLDTNMLSELRKPKKNPNVAAWFESAHGVDKYLSVLVVGEIRRGVESLARRDRPQAERYEEWLDKEVVNAYKGCILPVTLEVAQIWGGISAGDPLPEADGLIAATAIAHDLTLVTQNTKDMARTGVKLLNPFEFEPPQEAASAKRLEKIN